MNPLGLLGSARSDAPDCFDPAGAFRSKPARGWSAGQVSLINANHRGGGARRAMRRII